MGLASRNVATAAERAVYGKLVSDMDMMEANTTINQLPLLTIPLHYVGESTVCMAHPHGVVAVVIQEVSPCELLQCTWQGVLYVQGFEDVVRVRPLCSCTHKGTGSHWLAGIALSSAVVEPSHNPGSVADSTLQQQVRLSWLSFRRACTVLCQYIQFPSHFTGCPYIETLSHSLGTKKVYF